jgi:hypothetical protein
MSDVPNLDNVVTLPVKRYVRFSVVSLREAECMKAHSK